MASSQRRSRETSRIAFCCFCSKTACDVGPELLNQHGHTLLDMRAPACVNVNKNGQVVLSIINTPDVVQYIVHGADAKAWDTR